MKITDRELEILQHSLGLDQYGQGSEYRNHYVADFSGDSIESLLALEEKGLMKRTPVNPHLCGGGICFSVTKEGRNAIKENSPKPPALTKGQIRYRQFLEADTGLTFGE